MQRLHRCVLPARSGHAYVNETEKLMFFIMPSTVCLTLHAGLSGPLHISTAVAVAMVIMLAMVAVWFLKTLLREPAGMEAEAFSATC